MLLGSRPGRNAEVRGRMRLKTIAAFGVALAGLLVVAAPPLLAHHSFAAEYDNSQPLKLTGAVTKVSWANPHVYFFIDVKDPQTGRVANWAFEMGAPAVLTRS